MDIKEKVKNIKEDIPTIYLAIKHRDTPFISKLLAFITIGYALSPIDLIPDFIPVLGYLDDIIILPILIIITIKSIPQDVVVECRNESKHIWKDRKPKKWFYAIPIVLIWVFCILWIFSKINWFKF